MSIIELWMGLTADYAPLLPSAQSLVWARHLIWSVVIAAVGLGVSSRLKRLPRFSRLLPWVLALWAWVPGSWGVSYWLGLAFQIPSLSAAFLALSVLLHAPIARPFTLRSSVQRHHFWGVTWTLMAAVTGLVLMLDTFAAFDFSIYQWGFSPLALAWVLALALLPWMVSGTQALRQPPVWSLIAALAVFLLTRWPSGNIWDAVLDPWLCLVAWVCLLRAPWRRG